MPEVTGTVQATSFSLIPAGTVTNGHVIKVDDVDPDTGKIRKTNSGLGEQISLDWIVDEGEYANREIRYNNLSIGGHYLDKKTGEKKPLNISDLCNFLTHTGVAWNCNSCHNDRKSRKFHIGTVDDGPIKGMYVCPDCKSPILDIAYNTSDFLGARCGISIGTQKKTTTNADGTKTIDPDKEYNIIKGYMPLKD